MAATMTGADAGQLARRISELTGGRAMVRETDGAYRVELCAPGRNNRLGSLVAVYHSVEEWDTTWAIIGPKMEESA